MPKLISLENLGTFKDRIIEKYGVANGIAQLDANGKVPLSQLPADVFNVVEYNNVDGFPQTGAANTIYVDKSNNYLYLWINGEYVNSSSPESVKYIAQQLTDAQKAQARANIGALSQSDLSSINNAISVIESDVLLLKENVEDVVKTDEGIRVEYANGTSKDIEISSEFPIDSVVYDEDHYLHFYDKNGEDLFDLVYIAGGGGGAGTGSIKITRITNETISSVYGKSVPIQFSVEAKDSSDDDATLKGSSWSVNGITVARNVEVNQGENTFDIGSYLSPGQNTVKLTIAADTGGEADLLGTKTWRVNAVNMRFEWNFDDTRINTSSFVDSWTVYGDIEKTSHTKVDDTELATITTTKTGATQTIVIPMQTHGAHSIERWLTADIGGIPQQTTVEYHEMIFAESDNDTPIVAISKQDFGMKQYDTVQIPVVIYDPLHVQTTAKLYIDNEEIGEWDNVDRSTHYWAYTPTVDGPHTLKISCGETSKEIHVTVEAVELDVEEVPGYSFRFKSSEFASNDAVRAWDSNGITASFSDNFDWVNGGLHTEYDDQNNLQQYFCIKAGTRMTINHKLFASDPKDRGMTFKIIYKVENCRDYDAEIAKCFSDVGIRMYAHKAVFNSTGTSINVPYGEDEYTELEFDVYPQNDYRYMMAWIDGVITSCRVYDSNDSFIHPQADRQNIILGSDDCDVYIYMVKSYPMLVNRDGHIDNFIMDAPNATEMARRYKRNDILGDDMQIDYTKLVNNNPDCRVWVYDIPYLTNDKSDKVKNCSFNQFWSNGSQYYQLTGTGTMSVQGTSSVKYIRGAANTDINFTALEDGDGNNLMLNGTKDDTYGNNWYTEDSNNPGHAKQYTVLDAKIFDGIRSKYTPTEARRIARVGDEDPLPSNWVVYETDDQDEPVSYINTDDADRPNMTLGPEWVIIERDSNRNPVKYIHALGFKLNDDSCPITYSNTKVNFASCEQVNNMCNAAWYQRYNPYPSLTARDCMEFNMGVQFIKDSGNIPDDSHFVLWGDEKYHMYSIANMGNSKKNVHVLHDFSNPNEVCIEVNDNDKDQMRMVSDDLSEEDWSGDHFFGMRYPDTKNPSQEIRDAWQRLVTWMATSNPNAHTDEVLANPETYGVYTFRGHDRTGTQVLRGTTVTQYAGTYTHDTFERRMAKMLSECEDYMVMDSFMYHYVYLERHTMVDNVSKNNFWSSTDLLHWDLSKAYDMDTSDGNNNQGQMVFDYGNEWNDDIGGMKVFNGSDSVWFVFCANLYEAARTMFTNREAAGAWSAVAYHNFLLSEQQKVPERCWVQTYWYDYLRTYEQGINSEWMTFLDGGQKTHQRKHYEFFQELYDSSKYRGSASTSQNINFRAYTPNTYGGNVIRQEGADMRRTAQDSGILVSTIPYGAIVSISRITDTGWYYVTYEDRSGYVKSQYIETVQPKGEITITMYNKMYISVDAGTTALAPVKAERGVPTTINFSNGGTLNNTLIVVNTAPMIQSITGMENLYPDTCVFADASRLRELTIGSLVKGYENSFLRTLALGNNTMLERLYVQNLPNASSVLDLSNCQSLVYLDATGSAFTAYTFAPGGLLETAKINKPTSLSMIGLNHIDDESLEIADYSALISLRFENTPNVNAQLIINQASNLQIARIVNIDWLMSNTNGLNRIIEMQGMNENNITIPQSVLTGHVYSPSVRLRDLARYAEAWPNLVVEYDETVTSHTVRFYNPDGTTIKDRQGNDYIQYVDKGYSIEDPVEMGYIDTPTMEATAQYTYTFDGWENIDGEVLDDRDVTASYATTTRTYRVRWYKDNITLLKTVEAPYGSEVVYEDDDHEFPPTKTDEEQNFYFSVFKGWNKSTGFITENTDVYAIWERSSLPPRGTKNMKDMNVAEIYGVARKYQANDYFEDEDYVDIQVGKDFEFENVESELLLSERYFNGSEIVKFDQIKLFDENAPSFTLAVDYEFCESTTNATIVSCCDSTGNAEGFRVYYYLSSDTADNESVKVLWGDRTDTVGHGLNRGMLVLRHRKGSKNLLVASDNGGRYVQHSNSYGGDEFPDQVWAMNVYDAYNLEAHISELPRAQETQTDSVLSFGAMAYGTQGYRFPAKGWIHWAKIWYEDLGQNNIKELGSWPRETWRMHYRGNALYNKDDGTGLMDGASFIANAPLSQFYEMYPSTQYDTRGSWKNSVLRQFVNTRCLQALPYEWQSIIRPVNIVTKGGVDNFNNLEYTTDKIYVPSYADLRASSTSLISAEGSQISWFVDNSDRIKFMGITIPEDSQIITGISDDPTLYDTYTIKEGDIWIPSDHTDRGYVYVSATTAARHGYYGGRSMSDATNNIQARGSQGGMWIRSITYWTRTNNTTGSNTNTSSQWTVFPSGAVTGTYIYYQEYQRRGVLLMFSL